MIKISDIQKAIADRIKTGGNTVTAGEVSEAFDKPTFFIDIFPAETESQGAYYELVTLYVEIKYYPKIETKIECLKKAEELKRLFLGETLTVNDRVVSIESLLLNVESNVLICEFELSFFQASILSQNLQDEEFMQNLNFK